MKHFTRNLLAALMLPAALMGAAPAAQAAVQGWPAEWEGVMLQGFYWDSFTDTNWANLEANADEYSQYFKLIWVPNSGKSASNPGMGYDPVYWFTNHNSSFGTETQLRSMIATYKTKGTGIIADVVINHRSGKSNWTDFPAETWNGTTWQIGPEGICCNDEVASASGQAKPTGAYDTGENFDGSRDLDHTNANVQNNCKNYCKFLLEDLGYAGFRYDMVKGYGGQYNKIYNEYSQPGYSVGEYWDGQYDAVAAWIEATGRTSAAFDFPGKYAMNEAFSGSDMDKLCWLANGSNPQPAGLIHYGYPQYAVTFVDNHDTYRDGSKFTGNVVAANAFILCSPGTPCVFLPHYQQYTAQIQALINARNQAGVHNTSAVKVLRHDSSCYMAEVTGHRGKLVVKIGSAMVSPDGYTDSQIVASGTDYCVWSTVSGGTGGGGTGSGDAITRPAKLYLLGNIPQGAWNPSKGLAMTATASGFTLSGVTIEEATPTTPSGYGYFSFSSAIGTSSSDWTTVNASPRYGATSKDALITAGTPATFMVDNTGNPNAFKVATGEYTVTVDFTVPSVTLTQTGEGGGGDEPTPTPTPDTYTIYFDNTLTGWTSVNFYHWLTSGGTTVDNTWPGEAATSVAGAIWSAQIPAGHNIIFNTTGAQTADIVSPEDGYIYKATGATDTEGHFICEKTVKYGQGGGGSGSAPSVLYIVGTLQGAPWDLTAAIPFTKVSDDTFRADNIKLQADASDPNAFFTLITVLPATADDWDTVNLSMRYAPKEDGTLATPTGNVMTPYTPMVDAMAAGAWTVAPGTYTFTADFSDMTLSYTAASSICDAAAAPEEAAPIYYNLQGRRLSQPAPGEFVIVVRGGSATKELIR